MGALVLLFVGLSASTGPGDAAPETPARGASEAPDRPLTPAEQKRLELREKHAADGEADHPHRSALPPLQQDGDPLGRERVPSQQPYGDGQRWRNEREKQARMIHDEQLAAAEAWVGDAGLGPDEANEVIGVIDGLHAELAALRLRVEEGELSPASFREEAERLREGTAGELDQLVGPAEAESLRRALADASVGGGF